MSQIVAAYPDMSSGWVTCGRFNRCYDTQHNETQHNDNQYNDAQHNDLI